eukprot:scaffold1439_cov404-Prasinococcus_capsulatus_cf.AAC.42
MLAWFIRDLTELLIVSSQHCLQIVLILAIHAQGLAELRSGSVSPALDGRATQAGGLRGVCVGRSFIAYRATSVRRSIQRFPNSPRSTRKFAPAVLSAKAT